MSSPESIIQQETAPNPDVFIEHALLYHGSPTTGIENLNAAEDTTVGSGVYFTPDREPAMGYARHRIKHEPTDVSNTATEPVLYTVEIENTRLADFRNNENVQWLLEGIKPVLEQKRATSDNWIEQGRMQFALRALDRGNTRVGTLKGVTQNIGDELRDYLSDMGYDGLIAPEGGEGHIGDHESYVIFDPDKVKIVSEQKINPDKK